MKQYRAVIAKTIPALAPPPESSESDPTWSEEQAEALFFQRLKLEEESGTDQGGAERKASWTTPGGVPLSVSQATWRNRWTLYAAGILLLVARGVSTYQLGFDPSATGAVVAPIASQSDATALQQQVTEAGREREVLRAQMAQRDQVIPRLRRQLERQAAEVSQMKISQEQLGSSLQNSQANEKVLLEERS